MKKIAILGSTGSIGTQTIDIIEEHPEMYRASVLTAGSNVELLIEQSRRLRPTVAVIADEARYARLREALEPLGITTAAGTEALAEAAALEEVEMVVTATVGYSGLTPTLRAIAAGKEIALANKETLVAAGEIVTRQLASSPSRIIPVDSEHSAIYQCLRGERPEEVERLIITASGGPFRSMSREELARVTAADALRHPNWVMGDKITIDSATMINKAFEIIEARWLFDIPAERIEAVVHPQSIVHSMVAMRDGAVKAQLGIPDMHLPIAYALGNTSRMADPRRRLSMEQMAHLEFYEPDEERFPCLSLARRALSEGGTTACVINAANEKANRAFRDGQIGFGDIYRVIDLTLNDMERIDTPTIEDISNVNSEARRRADEHIKRLA
ncbi:MAG: 1-deoxy-D-xylulose-5-phosphate reductoisomerase [Pseudoflavonifractor sp.]|nr:1-deoxy-D-xylulose-5-phosphate reductoisomerase [Alloprevotella sp.]MCM1116808.1 1-deoxy-D-xylulose-5-phosphate reductoisomerase [Pseudoflavonifractor sp.]